MLLAIDAGNTNLVFGLWEDNEWRAVWRRATVPLATEDELAAAFFTLCNASGIAASSSPLKGEGRVGVTRAVCANVVPDLADALRLFGRKWLGLEVTFLSADLLPGLKICYDPPSAVGADRLANAIAAKAKYELPAVVVDFGTATTFDAVGPSGEYLGGSILPGVLVSMDALFARAARLPKVELALNAKLSPPSAAIGRDTLSSLQSGLLLGYPGAIDALARRMRAEMGGRATVVATGGLAPLFAPLCDEIETVDLLLTLDGLRLALP